MFFKQRIFFVLSSIFRGFGTKIECSCEIKNMNLKKPILYFVLSSFTFGILLNSCKDKKDPSPLEQTTPVETKREEKVSKPKKELMRYQALEFPENKKGKDSAMAAFLSTYSKEERYLILALNRLDQKNRWRAQTLIIPESFEEDFLKYTPFPLQVDLLKEVEKLVVFSYSYHAFGVFENGKLVKWGPSSLGKKDSPTKKGLHFTNWKKKLAISTVDSDWKLPYNFNIHNTLGIGWHQYDLPGFHASHSCLRLLEADAKWLYEWADMWVLTNQGREVKAKGTPVLVYGESDFESKPWLELLKDPKANEISEEELTSELSPLLEEILKEQKNSNAVRSGQE